MKIISLILALFLPSTSLSETIRIAVLDTGVSAAYKGNYCSSGHADTSSGKIVKLKSPPHNDKPYGVGHGTNVAAIIDSKIGKIYKKEYCLIIINIYPDMDARNSSLGIAHAIDEKASFINYSGGGSEFFESEHFWVNKAVGEGITFVAAAGNNGKELSFDSSGPKKTRYYPAMSNPSIMVIGALKNGEKLESSNYGDLIDIWEEGYNVYAGGYLFSGTSQATATATAKLVRTMIQSRIGEK